MSNDRFNWNDNSEAIVVRSYGSIAVYENDHGDVCICQEGGIGDEDAVVIIPKQNVEAVALALRSVLEADQKSQ